MIRLAFGAGIFAAGLGLLVTTMTAGAQQGVAQNAAPQTVEQEIKRVEAEIDKIFVDTLAQLSSIPADKAYSMKQLQSCRKLELFDKQLSVNRNTACTFCHMPDVDFTGPISILNATTVAYPGSVRNAS